MYAAAHARTRRSRPTRAAQALIATGLLVGGGAYAAHTPSDAADAAAAAAVTMSDPGVRIASVASRASGRQELFSVTAPAPTGPVRAAYGSIGVTAVQRLAPTASPSAGTATARTSGTDTATAKVSDAGAAGGSSTAYAAAGAALGLAPSAIAVYSAVRSSFGITNIGGYRPGDWGDHGTGHAVDVMITSSAQGDAVAAYAIANIGRFGIKYVIWQQRIWLPSAGAWRMMEDRGSPTQNHMDHVHISVN